MSLKIALVGCGKIADGHIEEIQKLQGTARIVAVCDRELLMAEQVAVRYAIPSFYDDFERLLEVEKPDVVHITTPPQSHLPLAMLALEAGCHIYVEKPLALNSCEAMQLIERTKLANKKLTIGYSYLFDPPALEMRDMVQKGILGDPIHVDSFFGYNLSGPFGAALLADGSHWVHRLPGKLVQNNIDHLLYKAIEFLDDEKPCVHASGTVRREHRYGDQRDDMVDELRVMIEGRCTSVSGVFSSHIRPVGNFMRVYGTKNTLHVDFAMRTVTVEASPQLPSAIGRLLPSFQQSWRYFREGSRNVKRFLKSDFHYFSGLNRLISLFYASISNDTPVPIPYRDILRIASMMDEIIRQVDKGSALR